MDGFPHPRSLAASLHQAAPSAVAQETGWGKRGNEAEEEKPLVQPSSFYLIPRACNLSSSCSICFGSCCPHHPAQGTCYDLQATSQKEMHTLQANTTMQDAEGEKKTNYSGGQGRVFMCSYSTASRFPDLINRTCSVSPKCELHCNYSIPFQL